MILMYGNTFLVMSFILFYVTATTEFYTTVTLCPCTTLFQSIAFEHPGEGTRGNALTATLGKSKTHHAHRLARHRTTRPGNAGCRDSKMSVAGLQRSEENTSELQSLMRISYDVVCLKKTQSQPSITTRTFLNTTPFTPHI